ncbi:MAG: FHA domain-containing protein [Acidobacteriota bacterium]|nr:FHA domain-containing protein [Acidobacteriota bacterium]
MNPLRDHQRGGGRGIRDLESANGTLVNGERVDAGSLEAEDEITLGPTVLECRRSLVPLPGPAAAGDAHLSFGEEYELDVVRKVVNTDPRHSPGAGDVDSERAQRNLATAYHVSRLLVARSTQRPSFRGLIDAIFQDSAAERAALDTGY